MGKNDAVGVRVQDINNGVGFNEGLDLAEDQRPLELIVRFISRSVLVDVLGQFAHQVPHKLHFLEQKANNDETSVIAEFFHHKVGPLEFVAVFADSARIIRPSSYSGVKGKGFVQVV